MNEKEYRDLVDSFGLDWYVMGGSLDAGYYDAKDKFTPICGYREKIASKPNTDCDNWLPGSLIIFEYDSRNIMRKFRGKWANEVNKAKQVLADAIKTFKIRQAKKKIEELEKDFCSQE